VNREPLDGDDSGLAAVHGDIPNWDDAVGDILSSNMARRKNSSPSSGHSGRGRR
jgi:hypothetical protein